MKSFKEFADGTEIEEQITEATNTSLNKTIQKIFQKNPKVIVDVAWALDVSNSDKFAVFYDNKEITIAIPSGTKVYNNTRD